MHNGRAPGEGHRELVRVPEEVMFATKPQLAGALLDRADCLGIRAAALRHPAARDELCGGGHPAAPARPGTPAALVHLATPPPAPRLPSPSTLERLRRDNTMITTNYSCRIIRAKDSWRRWTSKPLLPAGGDIGMAH